MKPSARLITIALLLGPPSLAMGADTCDFDQAAVARQLAERAARQPGATFDRRSGAFRWRLASGASVTVWHGGCVHLATTVTLTFDKRTVPSEAQAVASLRKALADHWSTASARAFDTAWRAGQFGARHATGRGAEYSVAESDDFPLGATLLVSPTEATLSWDEA